MIQLVEGVDGLILNGNCLNVLKELPDNSVDSIITDPPYGLGFMGKEWDTFDSSQFGRAGEEGKNDLKVKKNFKILPRIAEGKELQIFTEKWAKECFRVLKPGGHLLSFGGTRTYHRMAVAIEDVGFEIRDMIEWVYGSGFPKSLNIGKAVDKLQGNERDVVGDIIYPDGSKSRKTAQSFQAGGNGEIMGDTKATKGTSEWEGWGTALKPAHEPICMARKPLSEKTVAENCLKYGTGGINIDGSRVGFNSDKDIEIYDNNRRGMTERSKLNEGDRITEDKTYDGGWKKQNETPELPQGRFPANLIHDNSEEVRECFPETKSGGGLTKRKNKEAMFDFGLGYEREEISDSGNASRFFKSIIYTAKASKSERTAQGTITNGHPTIKPIALMEYLIKMVTPKGGTVLDPFMGSGSTGVACKQNNYDFIGIELDPEYCKIAEARIASVSPTLPI